MSTCAPQPPDLTHAARVCFESAAGYCARRVAGDDATLHEDVPALLRAVFDADMHRCASLESKACSLPCRRPAAGVDGYGLFDDELIDLSTEAGRVCKGGSCCDSCSRVWQDRFATEEECEVLCRRCASLMPLASRNEEATLTLARCAEARDVGATLLLLRLIERMRRAICRAYSLPLEALSPESAFVSRIPCGASSENYGRLHADESSNAAFHYSAVVYLTTQGEDFEGGDFVFSDDSCTVLTSSDSMTIDQLVAEARASGEGQIGSNTARDVAEGERRLTRLAPIRGRAVFFSSGWENLHFVDAVTSGTRISLPMFFTTGQSGGDSDGGGMDYVERVLSLWK